MGIRILYILIIIAMASVVDKMSISDKKKKRNYIEYKEAKKEFDKAVERTKKN